MRHVALSVLICLVLASGAQAAITYEFDGTYSSFLGSGIVNFDLTTSDLLTTDATFVPGLSMTCNACDRVDLFQDAIAHGLGGTPASAIAYQLAAGGGTYYFYFDPGAFAVLGTHDTILLQGINDATLKISGPVSTPEPTSLALLLIPAAGLLLRRRRVQ